MVQNTAKDTGARIPDPLANYIPVNLHDAYDLVADCFKAKNSFGIQKSRVPNLISSPGIGKSSLIKQIAEDLELLVIDVRLSTIDPTELNGFPHIWEVNDRKVASYIPMEMFPVIGTELPINPKTGKPYKGWILFLDEFNAGTLLVQAAAYKIVLDRMVGMYMLDDRCYMATAGNLTSDKAIVNRLSTATQSRVIHLPIMVDHDTWHYWADGAGIDHRVRAFLKLQPELLHKFDPNHTDLTFPCPRTWEFMSDIMGKYDPIPMAKLPLMAGTVGKGAARAYLAYTEVYASLPTIDKIIANPMGVTFRNDPSIEHALTGMVGHYMNERNVKPLLEFISRLGADFQVVALRQAIGRDYDLLQNTHVTAWLKHNMNEFIRRR